MTSVITDRVSGAVAGAPVNPGSIIQAIDVTGTDVIVADTFPNITAYFGNQLFLIRPFAANTGAVTLNLGPGALPWRTPSGAEFAAAALSPSLEYLIKLNEAATEFRTVSPF